MEAPEQFKIINKLGLLNSAQGLKYYKKLKIKLIDLVDPPMGKKRAAVEGSEDLMTSGALSSPSGGILGECSDSWCGVVWYFVVWCGVVQQL